MSARIAPRRWSLEPQRRPSFLVPRLAAAFIAAVSLTLLAIGARAPYTHANLLPGYDVRYTRTDEITVGPPVPFSGIGAAEPTSGDAVTSGATLFVTEGCVTCHALDAGGGVVGPPVAGKTLETVLAKVRNGPGGMPRYSTEALTDAQAAEIAAFLQSLTDAPQ